MTTKTDNLFLKPKPKAAKQDVFVGGCAKHHMSYTALFYYKIACTAILASPLSREPP